MFCVFEVERSEVLVNTESAVAAMDFPHAQEYESSMYKPGNVEENV